MNCAPFRSAWPLIIALMRMMSSSMYLMSSGLSGTIGQQLSPFFGSGSG